MTVPSIFSLFKVNSPVSASSPEPEFSCGFSREEGGGECREAECGSVGGRPRRLRLPYHPIFWSMTAHRICSRAGGRCRNPWPPFQLDDARFHCKVVSLRNRRLKIWSGISCRVDAGMTLLCKRVYFRCFKPRINAY